MAASVDTTSELASDGRVAGPAPRPCGSCPYRCDVPSGIWHSNEYAKLINYDAPTWGQPQELFLCHQAGADDRGARLCSGWVGCHRDELLAVRLAAARGDLSADDFAATLNYASPVPLFGSGAQAAVHGMRDIDNPTAEAQHAMDKIVRRRPEIDSGC